MPDSPLKPAMQAFELAIMAGKELEKYNDDRRLTENLETGTRLARRSVMLTRAELFTRLLLLASCLRDKLVNAFSVEVFTEAIKTAQEAVKIAQEDITLTETGYGKYLYALEMLAELYRRKYIAEGHSCDLDEIDESIKYMQQLINAKVDGNPTKIVDLTNLVVIQGDKYEASGLIGDALSAVESASRAEKLAEGQGSEYEALAAAAKGGALLALCLRGSKLYGLDQLDTAIQKMKHAIGMTPTENSEVAMWKHNLASLLELLFEQTGSMETLNKAIEHSQAAVKATASDNRQKARRLNALGNLLGRKFEWTGESTYLNESIFQLESAKSLSSEYPNSEKAHYLSNLAFALATRYRRQKGAQDLKDAVEISRKACEAGEGLPDEAIYLNTLSTNLLLLYDEEQKQECLEDAVEAGLRARTLTADDTNNPFQQSCSNTLALALTQRFYLLKEPKDFKDAVKLFQEANSLRSLESPDRATSLVNLGNLYYKQSDQTDYTKALFYFEQAYDFQQGHIQPRLRAAQMAMEILRVRADWKHAREIGSGALKLLSDLCERSLTLDDQQYAILQATGLAADVCSLYLQDSLVTEALQKLEFGRGLILRYMIDRQSEVPALERDCPDLAPVYRMLQHQVSQVVEPSLKHSRQQQVAQLRIEAGEKLKDIIRQIRQNKGYESFLLEPSVEELTSCCTADGVVVVVNATSIRADAIIISSGRISSIWLPEMMKQIDQWSADQAYQRYRSVVCGTPRVDRDISSESTKEDNKMVLEWLWDSCVERILEKISPGPDSSPKEELRIWWIGTGMASALPFHAAGRHDGGLRASALWRAVSSYTPSIKALSHSRYLSLKRSRSNAKKESVLIVAMPTTPGQQDLDGVGRECDAVEDLCKEAYACEVLDHPTADQVCAKLATSKIIHFACHGAADEIDPSKSYLLLQKNGMLDNLTVSRISRTVSRGPAWIAYLSACSTAQVKARKLADESLHIASAFQVAGFPHVIGSLWPTDDDVCVEVARSFYAILLEDGESIASDRGVASALRRAVLQVRTTKLSTDLERDPMVWAAYIHLGA